MMLGTTEEHEELRASVRRFLADKAPLPRVRELMETEDGTDAAVWQQAGAQLGLQGLAIPEAYGGAGFTFAEQAIVLEEFGAALYGGPYLASAVLAATALLASPDEGARRDLLPGIASGETIATLAFTEDDGSWDPSAIRMTAVKDGDAWKLDGHKSFVLDGHGAGLILVVAQTSAGLSLFAVEGTAAGLTRSSLPTLDQTRKLARCEFADVARRATPRRPWSAPWTWPPSRWPPSSSAGRSGRWTWRWSTRRSGISSAARSAASRRSSTAAPTCCSRSSRCARR
jgi:alkylation response protein AidB-like acyl-CoA dehydrogenase